MQRFVQKTIYTIFLIYAVLVFNFQEFGFCVFASVETPKTQKNSQAVTDKKQKTKAKTKISDKQKIEFTTKDKFILSGDLYLANQKNKKPLVILSHSYGLSARYWSDLPEMLQKRGYNVLTMDLRGHGRSVYNENMKLKSRYSYTNETWKKLPSDLIQSINYIKTNYPNINCQQVYLVGSDLGANASILAGIELKPHPLKIVLISPMLNFKGLYVPIKAANYKNTKFFILLSKSDKLLFNLHTVEKPLVKTYPLGGQGNLLLRANKGAIDDIVNFLDNKL